MGDTFHHAAVAGEDVGVVVDNFHARAVEAPRQFTFCNRHTDGIGQALSEWPGGGLDAWRNAARPS